MGDGFYNTLFDDYFKIDGLEPVSPEEVDARLTGFLEALDQKVTDMPTSPFIVVIRDNEEDLDEDEKLTKKKLTQNRSALDRAIANLQQLKTGIKSKEHKEQYIKIAKTNIKENLATLGRLATEARESYQELQANHDDLSILHELLSDSKVTYLQSITHEYNDSFVSAFRSIYIGR